MGLRVSHLKKSFGKNEILKDVSFRVAPGEVVCIQGRSGEGKTTLLRSLVNLEQVDGGSIQIGDRYLCREDGGRTVYADKSRMGDIRKDLGFVFQSYHLFPHMTVMENLVEAPLTLLDKADRAKEEERIYSRARDLIRDLELEGREDFYPYQLSGGQKQRVAIARACMLNPSVLCFDEPTSAVDEETRGQISKIIRDLADQGLSIIVVTHDNDLVGLLADRCLRLKDGLLTEEKVGLCTPA